MLCHHDGILHSFISSTAIKCCTLYQSNRRATVCLVRNPLPIEVQALSKHMIHSEIYTFGPSLLFPLSSFTTRWRLDRHWSFLDILPVSAERSASALLEAFHHCPFGVVIGIGEQILEELVQRAIAAHVGVICDRFGLLRLENGLGHAVPIFTGLRKGRTGLCGRGGGRSGRVGESWSVT